MTAVFEAFSQRHGSGGAFLYHKRPQHFRRMILICTTENGESRGDPRTSRLQNSLRLLMIVWWSGALKTSFELWAHPSAFLARTFEDQWRVLAFLRGSGAFEAFKTCETSADYHSIQPTSMSVILGILESWSPWIAHLVPISQRHAPVGP